MARPLDKKKYPYMFSDDMKFVQKAVIFHPNDPLKFLTMKRSDSSFTNKGSWDLPGGNVLYGETHIDSMRTEVLEETGLNIANFTPFYVHSDYQSSSEYNNSNELYYIMIAYTARATTSEVVTSHEHSDFKWVTRQEFLDICTIDYLQNIIHAL